MDVTLEHNRPITDADVVRCRELVAEIDARANATGAYEAELAWTNADGAEVYGGRLDSKTVTERFLATLPQHAFFFTGWTSEVSLTPLGKVVWFVMRRAAPAFGLTILLKGEQYFLRQARFGGIPPEVARCVADRYALRLPQELRPSSDFDGTDLDRLALCERLLVMHHLGVFDRLATLDKPIVLEIGAGYGMLAAALRRAFPRCLYMIVDLPHSLALSACYLASRRLGHLALARPGVPAFADIELLLNTDLQAIEGRGIDLAINTLSFGEMGERTVEDYAAFLQRNLAVDGALFEQNFDNAHVRRLNFCNPQVPLARYLRQRKALTTVFYLKGTPRLWVRS